MITNRMLGVFTLAAAVSLAGCGGGGGGGGGGGTDIGALDNTGSVGGESVAGSNSVSSGTIDGFGSIFVNGAEFETDGADILVDGWPASEEDLALGMVVLVAGTVNEDGVTGDAVTVIFDDEVEGPIEIIELGSDGDSMLITVLGLEVILERTGTVFDDVSFDTLAVGDVVEISGFVNEAGTVRATRLEKTDDFVPGVTEVELKGEVSNLSGSQFNLGDTVVDISGADLGEVPGGELRDSMLVEVHGTMDGGLILASRVEQEDGIAAALEDDDEVSVQGTITNFVSQGNFLVDGVAVNASVATLSPSSLALADGVVVEAEGVWDGSVLRASEVEARRGRVEIEGTVAGVDTAGGSLTLRLAGGTVTVQVDSQTLMEDDTDMADPLTLADINSGDFLEVEAIGTATGS